MNTHSVDLQIEAALLAAKRPLSLAELERVTPRGFDVHASIGRLSEFWGNRASRIEAAGDGWRFVVDRTLLPTPKASRTKDLGEGSIGALAVVAIHQPVTYTRISEIRRKKLYRPMISDLEKAGLVEARRRRTGSGQAVEYVVTRQFLDEIGIQTILDFPTAEEALALGFREDERS